MQALLGAWLGGRLVTVFLIERKAFVYKNKLFDYLYVLKILPDVNFTQIPKLISKRSIQYQKGINFLIELSGK
jgi:hypothetical protein